MGTPALRLSPGVSVRLPCDREAPEGQTARAFATRPISSILIAGLVYRAKVVVVFIHITCTGLYAVCIYKIVGPLRHSDEPCTSRFARFSLAPAVARVLLAMSAHNGTRRSLLAVPLFQVGASDRCWARFYQDTGSPPLSPPSSSFLPPSSSYSFCSFLILIYSPLIFLAFYFLPLRRFPLIFPPTFPSSSTFILYEIPANRLELSLLSFPSQSSFQYARTCTKPNLSVHVFSHRRTVAQVRNLLRERKKPTESPSLACTSVTLPRNYR